MTDIERPWLASYPPGVPARINLDEYRSIAHLLEMACERFSHRPAFENMGKVLTYADVDRLSRQFAAYLLNELKLQRGDRVAIMLPNVLQYPIAIFGALRAGLTVVNTNPMYTARELRHQLHDASVSAIVVLDNFAATLAEVLHDTPCQHVITTAIGDMLGFPKSAITNLVIKHVKKMVPAYSIPHAVRFNAALARGARKAPPQVTIGHGDLAFLQYTGGTTGVAKGAMLSHGNMVANMQQVSAWVSADVHEGEEVIVTAIPLYHIFALTNSLAFMKFGGLDHLITNPRDMAGFVKTLQGIRMTAIPGVNTLFNGLLNTPGFDKVDFSRLHLTLGGGTAVQRAVAERWRKVTGVTLVEAYGLTETSPGVCINPMNLPDYNGAIGLPIPSTDVSVQDDDGKLLPTGAPGELCVRGPQVMQGYWQKPEETAKVITPDGWLHTGDIAKMDEKGYFYIVDRKKDMILVSGFNVYPNEIEDVVAQCPGVLEVAAVGVPDEKSGEAVKIVVVRKDPALTAEMLKAHCKANLTGYKLPKIIEFRDALPKTNVGKILRRELRDAPKATA